MTEVIFHVNVPDRLQYTCRLLRKALRKGAHVAVTGSGPTLAELDKILWTFDDEEFLPHAVVTSSSQGITSAQTRAPLQLAEDLRLVAQRSLLVNLRDDLAPGFESFQRLFEIVPADESGRMTGRARWRAYLDGGYAPTKHEAAA